MLLSCWRSVRRVVATACCSRSEERLFVVVLLEEECASWCCDRRLVGLLEPVALRGVDASWIALSRRRGFYVGADGHCPCVWTVLLSADNTEITRSCRVLLEEVALR